MLGKTIGLFSLGLSTISFVTWGAIEAKESYKYNSKMKEYGEWRDEFFNKQDPIIKELICEEKEGCLNSLKEYLPKPNEDSLWEIAYKSFSISFSESSYKNIENLKNIKNSEEWKNYCYGEIKKDNDKKGNFNPSGKTLGHEYCVLSKRELNK